MSLVVDASVVVAALLDTGPAGSWAQRLLAQEDLAAPHLMPAEVASILRRLIRSGDVSSDLASLALADVGFLPVAYFPFDPFADRVWQLRDNVTAHDAWYVALAEELAAPLVTLDLRLGRASGPRCEMRTPPG